MRREQFQSFLVSQYRGPVNRRPLGDRSASSYCAYAAKVEECLAINLDNADLSSDGIVRLLSRLRATRRLPENSLNNSGSAVRAYAQFLGQ
jgi:hypothetical protein